MGEFLTALEEHITASIALSVFIICVVSRVCRAYESRSAKHEDNEQNN